MQTKTVLFFAFIGLCCLVDVHSQAPPDLAQFLPKNLPPGVSEVIQAVKKLQSDIRDMQKNKKFDADLLKKDIDAIVAAAKVNGIPIPAATQTEIDKLSAALQKMKTDGKFDPKVLRDGVVAIITSFNPTAATSG